MSGASGSLRSLGEEMWKKTDKANADFFVQLYGAFIKSMLKELEYDPHRMTAAQLKYTREMGSRLADEFFAKSNLSRCKDFRECADVLAKVAFKMFLNITPTVTDISPDSKEFSLVFEEDPLVENVVLPEYLVRTGNIFSYSGGFYTGCILGAFETIGINLTIKVIKDKLLGDDHTVLKISFVSLKPESRPPKHPGDEDDE